MDWFPPQRRGMASSAVTGSMSLGSVLAAGLTALLLPLLGWRGVFFAYAAVGLAWVVAFSLGFRNRPEEHPAANAAERALARGGGSAGPRSPAAAPPATRAGRLRANRALLAAMATSSSAWLICAQAACRAFGAQFYLTWFPAFLEKGHGIRLEKSGLMAMLPLAGSVLGAVAGGAVIDWLLRRTGSRRLSRSGTGAVVLVFSALCILAATRAEGAMAMVLLLALGNFCLGMGGPASWATTMDISGQHTQVVFGLQNMCGNVGAMVCPIVVGALFDRIQAGHGDWNEALVLIAAVYLAGALCWAFLNPARSAVARRD
jgi:predicted MFS family arabinose efflux permease